jgi:hypothetical protein
MPPLQVTEIEKPQLDRLLDFVNELPRQKDPGDVRLDELDVVNRVRVGAGLEQPLDQLRAVRLERQPARMSDRAFD